MCTLVKFPKPRDSRVPRLVNPPPTISNNYKVVFHFCCLPFWSSSILIVFHFGLTAELVAVTDMSGYSLKCMVI